MNTRWTWASLFGLAAVAAVLMISSAASQPQAAPRKTVFSSLKTGQPVTVKDKGHSVEISTMEEDTVGTHTVVEVGDDYIVLRDVAGVTESRVPVYAIRGIVYIKTRPK